MPFDGPKGLHCSLGQSSCREIRQGSNKILWPCRRLGAKPWQILNLTL